MCQPPCLGSLPAVALGSVLLLTWIWCPDSSQASFHSFFTCTSDSGFAVLGQMPPPPLNSWKVGFGPIPLWGLAVSQLCKRGLDFEIESHKVGRPETAHEPSSEMLLGEQGLGSQRPISQPTDTLSSPPPHLPIVPSPSFQLSPFLGTKSPQ